ncbi:MAG: D-arabinono-1,4-lactone oxidase [Nannocystaceae bacterium]
MKRSWKNWLGNQTARAYYHAPKSVAELCEVVRKGAKRGKVRPVGNGFAWARLVPTSDTLVSLKHLNRLLEVDHHRGTITLESGMSMQQLTRATQAYGLELESPTVFPRVSIGGALATGSHGTGRDFGTLSDSVVALTVVDPNGNLLEIDASKPDLLDAARVALGAFGVLYSVTLKVSRAFNIRVEVKTFPRKCVLEHIPDILRTYEFVEMYWFPYTDTMWLRVANRTREELDSFSFRSTVKKKVHNGLILAGGSIMMPLISNFLPKLTPAIVRNSQGIAFQEKEVVAEASVEFHYQTAYPKIWDMSIAVPTAHTKQSWELIMDLVDEYHARGKFPVNFVAHARYINASTGLICPAVGRRTTPIEVVTGWRTPGVDQFYGDLETQFYDRIPESRPHWGKFITRPERIKDQYPAANWQKFLDLRKSFDPQRVFLNRFLEHQVFQLDPLAGSPTSPAAR